MESIQSLSDLITQKYIPALSGQLPNSEEANKLLKEMSLTTEQLQEFRDSENISRFPHNSQLLAGSLLYARLAESLLHRTHFNSESSMEFVGYLKYLMENEPEFIPTIDAVTYIARAAAAILGTETVRELHVFRKGLNFISEKKLVTDTEQLMKTLVDRYYIVMITDQVNASTVEGIQRQLENIISIINEGIEIDGMSSVKSIAAVASTYFLMVDEVSDEIKMEIIGQLEAIGVENESVRQQIEDLSHKYGSKPAGYSFGDDIPNLAPSINEANANARDVSSRQQLQFDIDDLFANANGDPKIYVRKATYQIGNTVHEVAVKEYISKDPNKLNEFKEKEAEIMKHFSGRREIFLTYYGQYLEKRDDNSWVFGIVMELCSQSLMEYITALRDKGQRFTDLEISKHVYSLIDGFACMEQNNIYHLDIKPHNIFITPDGGYKIADFNISEKIDNQMSTMKTGEHPLQGTDGYMAIELQDFYDRKQQGLLSPGENPKYRKEKIDTYSLGMTILQMYTLENVKGYNRSEYQQGLQKKLDEVQLPWLKDLLKMMLTVNYSERPTMRQCLGFVQGQDTVTATIRDS